jgi:capsular exopolysaccharide synthesis family protein
MLWLLQLSILTKNNYNYSSNQTNPGIELVNYKIQNTIATLKENIKNILKSNEISINEINRRIGEIDAEISQLPETEKELIGIKRRYKLNDDIYTYLLTKRAEAGIAKASNVPDNKILDYAREDNAVLISPKRSLNYAIALIIGLLIPILIILMLDFFNDKIVERKDVEETTSIPILGEIGHNNKETDMVVLEKPKSSIAESFRTLRTNIQYFNIDMADKTRVISITSTISGEGKSFCAINLASIFALGDKKTLLMGIDLRKPKLHRELNTDNIKGLSTYLVGTHTLDEVIIPTHQNNLFFMPAGPVPPNPAELIETTKMVNLVNLLKEKYDMIIMDTPPIALVTDALLLAKYSDINLFVIRQNYSRKNMVKLINELFQEKGFKNVGIVINDIKIQGYYGYTYYGNYGYGKYGYRYGNGRYGYGDSSGYYEDDHENGSSNKPGMIARLFGKKQ